MMLYYSRKEEKQGFQMSKALVLGKGPSLLTQCKGKDISKFDKVIRMNNYVSVKGLDEYTNTWVYYPLHHTDTRPEFEKAFNVYKYFPKFKEVWIVHEFTLQYALHQLHYVGRTLNYMLSDRNKSVFMQASELKVPTTGMLAIWATLLQGHEVYVAGFDFYQGDKQYYFDNTKPKKVYAPHDNPLKEKAWFDLQVKEGVIKLL